VLNKWGLGQFRLTEISVYVKVSGTGPLHKSETI